MADNLDPDLLRQINEDLYKLNQTVNNMVPSFVLMTAAVDDALKAQTGSSSAMKNGRSVVEEFFHAQQRNTIATKAAAEAQEKENQANAKRQKGQQEVTSALKSFFNTLSDSDNITSHFLKGMTSLGTGVGSYASVLFKGAQHLELFFKGIEFAVSSVVDLNKAVMAAHDSLATIGVALPSSELQYLATVAGYSGKDIEKFGKLLTNNSEAMLAFGSATNLGAKGLIDVLTLPDDLKRRYRETGFTLEALNEHQLHYLKLQGQTGSQIDKNLFTEKQLQKVTLQYVEDLQMLAALTGTDLETQKKRIEAQRQEFAYRSYLLELETKAKRAEATGTDEGKEEARRLRQRAKNLEMVTDALGVALDPQQMAGVFQYATTGLIENSNSFLVTTFNGLTDMIDEATNTGSRKLVSDMLGLIGSRVGEANELLGNNMRMAAGQSLRSLMGFNNQTVNFASKMLEVQAEGVTDVDEFIKKVKQKMAVEVEGRGDPRVAAAAEQEARQNAARAFQSLVELIQGPVTKALTWFSESINKISLMILRVTNNEAYQQLQTQMMNDEQLLDMQKQLQDQIKELRDKAKEEKEGFFSSLPRKLKEGYQEGMLGKEKADPSRYDKDIQEKQKQLENIQRERQQREVKLPPKISKPGEFEKSKIEKEPITGRIPDERKPALQERDADITVPKGKPVSDINKILDLIKSKESVGGSYDSLWPGRVHSGLSDMTIDEVLSLQNRMTQHLGLASSAAGAYQFMPETLKGLMKQGFAKRDEKFNQDTQDRLAKALIYESGWTKFKEGTLSPEKFGDALAKRWAAFPIGETGLSKYDSSINKATISRSEFLNALVEKNEPTPDTPKMKKGGIISGSEEGYPVTMHGKELVHPLSPNSILEKLATTPLNRLDEAMLDSLSIADRSSKRNIEIITRVDKLGDLIDKKITQSKVFDGTALDSFVNVDKAVSRMGNNISLEIKKAISDSSKMSEFVVNKVLDKLDFKQLDKSNGQTKKIEVTQRILKEPLDKIEVTQRILKEPLDKIDPTSELLEKTKFFDPRTSYADYNSRNIDPAMFLQKIETKIDESVSTTKEEPKVIEKSVSNDSEILTAIKEMQVDFYDQMLDKMDSMIDKINQGNDIQDKILRVSRT